MRNALIWLTVLLSSIASHAQVMSATQFGLAKAGTGLSVNASGVLSVTASGGTATAGVAFTTVSTYAALIALAAPAVMTLIKVTTDADKGVSNTQYGLWPDGVRTFGGLSDQLIDYTTVGTTIFDGGSSWGNDPTLTYDKAFDGNIATYFRSGSSTPWVGRNMGSAKALTRVTLLPVQNSTDCTNLNGAQVQYSSDGSSWTNIGSAVSGVSSANYTSAVVVNFTATSAQYWRVSLVNFGWLAEMKLFLVRA